uniref:HTH CENPB-type domain-containing protein n=1 Tax=Parastrongyloides trichosuri TaxID=131310 RepID=A0A0N4ZAW7_PARTI
MSHKRMTHKNRSKSNVIEFAILYGSAATCYKYGINELTLRKWRKQSIGFDDPSYDEQLDAEEKQIGLLKQMESQLRRWFIKEREINNELTLTDLKNEADRRAKILGAKNFKGTLSWCQLFLKEYNLRLKNCKAGKNNFPKNWETKIETFKNSVEEKLPGVDLKYIANMDEIPMTFNVPARYFVFLQSDRTVNALNFENEKISFTVTLTITADGSKLPPFVIFKHNTDIGDQLLDGAISTTNDRGYMTKKTMMKWFERIWKKRIGNSKDTKSILIYDSAPAHKITDFVSKVRAVSSLHIIPTGLTKTLQPLNHYVKERFRKNLKIHWKKWMIESFDTYNRTYHPQDLSFMLICDWIQKSWQDVPTESIKKAFKRTKINFYGNDEVPIDDDDSPITSDVESIDIPAELEDCLVCDDIESDNDFEGFL